MARSFNVTGSCSPKLHYMVDITGRLEEIKALVDDGKYFTINRARQYGKTTTIRALTEYLANDYIVIPLDFQKLSNADFVTETIFSKAFVRYLLRTIRNKKNPIGGLDGQQLSNMEKACQTEEQFTLGRLFDFLNDLCDTAAKPIVMIIDEVDSASNNQVFLDFLAQLRGLYLDRENYATFQSVILAGVHDVKNIKMKIRPESAHKVNSPWNTREGNEENGSVLPFDDCSRDQKELAPFDIATDFLVDMSFNTIDIKGMLAQYEADHHTGMDMDAIADLIFDSTSGYPFLVSRLCQLVDERIAGTERFPDEKAAWTKAGYLEAEKLLISEKNTLFDSLTGKLLDYPELKKLLQAILFNGLTMSFANGNPVIEMASMYGFIRNANGTVAIANRIFETVLYNLFLSEEELNSAVYASALSDKYQFIKSGHLDMKLVLERFVQTFSELYQDESEKFREEIGRKYFMLFLRPIINGTGHSYVEARTRDMKRTDIVVNYHDEEFVIELKIWRGAKYHAEGEQQTLAYLDAYALKKGYMLVFNFNKDKEIGVKEIQYGDYTLVEAVV